MKSSPMPSICRPAERAAFLDRACGGDAALRSRIAALLAGHDTRGISSKPPAPPARPTARGTARRHDRPLHPARKIGEGGCGVVYLAEQREPVRRRVALKVIKLGWTRAASSPLRGRAPGPRDDGHPDIARVFDAGATAEGRPFFVMEFVDGVPITKFCDEHSLSMAPASNSSPASASPSSTRTRKASSTGNVKPSNILVALHDGVPTPKVIDFGIAKATQGRLTDRTLLTSLDQFIGTPA